MQQDTRLADLVSQYQQSKAELMDLLHQHAGHDLQELSQLTLRQLDKLATKEGIQ